MLWKYQRCGRTQDHHQWTHNNICRCTQLLAVIYNLYIILYYIDLIELWEPANGTNQFLLHVAVQSGLQGVKADRLSRYSRKSSKCQLVRCVSVSRTTHIPGNQFFMARHSFFFCLYICVFALTLYGFAQRLYFWCVCTLRVRV